MRYLILFLLIVSCSRPQTIVPESVMDQMIGRWDAQGTAIIEQWSKMEDGSYHGVVTSHAGPEPEVQELIDLKKEGDAWAFIGQVVHHEHNELIWYKLVEVNENRLHFENKDRVFPQSIEYFIVTKDKIKARISGSQNGQNREFIISYYRLPEE